MCVCRVALVFMILGCLRVSGQQKIDSLRVQLDRTLADTARIDVWLALSAAMENDSVAMHYLNESISLSKKINDHLRIAKSYYRLTGRYHLKGDMPHARRALTSASEQLPYFDDPKLDANIRFYYGVLDYLDGNYDDAIASLFRAASMYEKLGDSQTAASCYVNIGNCYKELNNDDNALKYFSAALKNYEALQYENGIAMALGNIGNIHKHKDQPDSALYCYTRSLEINLKNNLQDDARVDYNNIGNLYLDQQRFDQALPYFHKSYAIARAIGSQRGMLLAGFNMGVIKLKTGHPQAAIDTFRSQLEPAQRLHLKDHTKELYAILSTAHEDLGQYAQALAYRKQYETWKDSLVTERHLNTAKELEVKYETEKKDKAIQLLAKEKELQENEIQRQATLKNTFIIGLVTAVALGVSIIYAIRQKLLVTTKNNELREINLRHQLADLEMKALRAQINPHFMFNCINSINRMIVKGENENASLYLKKFSHMVRLIVENAETSRVSLKNELSLIESYIQLEELRFKGKIAYEINLDEGIDTDDTFLPSMVIQPFIENAIWHGLTNKDATEQGQLSIRIQEKNDLLVCTIEDNGVGRGRSAEVKNGHESKTKSIGIRVTEERLRLLNKTRTDNMIRIFDLTDSDGKGVGTRVVVNIPL